NGKSGDDKKKRAIDRPVDFRPGDGEGSAQGEHPDRKSHGRSPAVEANGFLLRLLAGSELDIEGGEDKYRPEYAPVKPDGDRVSHKLLAQDAVKGQVACHELTWYVLDKLLEVRAGPAIRSWRRWSGRLLKIGVLLDRQI